MAFDVNGARDAGYSDTAIIDFLAEQKKFDVASARKAGYDDDALLEYLNPRKKTETPVEEPQKEATLGSRVIGGAKQLASSTETGVKAIFGSPEEAAQAAQVGLTEQERIAKEKGRTSGWEETKKAYETAGGGASGVLAGAGEFLSQVPGAVAENLPQLGTMFAGARLGAIGGGAIGSVVPIVGTGAGALIGGIGGAAATMYPQFFGSNAVAQAEEAKAKGQPLELDRSSAAIAAAGQTALEAAGGAYSLGKNLVSKLLSPAVVADALKTTATAEAKKAAVEELVKTASRSLAGAAGRGAVRGAVEEVPVEVAQQILERWQAGKDLLSDDAFKDYGQSAYGALQAGPVLGGTAGVVDRSSAKSQLTAQNLTPAGTAINPELSPEERAAREEEQQTVGHMRGQREAREAETAATAPFMGQEDNATPEGQFGLNLEGGKRAAPTTTVQGETLPTRKAGYDAYGRPKETTEAAPAETQPLWQLYETRDKLTQQLNAGPVSPQAQAQLTAQIGELNGQIKAAESGSQPAPTQPLWQLHEERDKLTQQLNAGPVPPVVRAQLTAQIGALDDRIKAAAAAPQAATPTTTTGGVPTPLTQELDKTQPLQQHYAEREQLVQQRDALPDTPQARAIRQQLNGRIGELNKLIKTAESVPVGTQGALPVVPSATAAPAPAAPAEPVKSTGMLLREAGVPGGAAVTQQLKGLDLSKQADRTAAAQFIAQALANPNVKPETKAAIQAFYDQHIAQPAPDTQGGLNLGEPQPLAQTPTPFTATTPTPTAPAVTPTAPAVVHTPDTAPSTIDDSVWNALGIGKTAKIRKNVDVNGKDITHATDGAFVRKALEAYRDATKSQRIKDNIDKYLARFPAPAPTAAATPTAATPTAPTTPKTPVEQRVESGQIEDWAKKLYKYNNIGTIMYADNNFALIYKQTGSGFDYDVLLKNRSSTISINTALVIMPPSVAADIAEAHTLIEARENAALAKTPDGPFTNATNNVVASASVDPRYVQYLTALMQKLGMGNINLFLFHDKDLVGNKDLYNLHGPYSVIAKDPNQPGSKNAAGWTHPYGPAQDALVINLSDTASSLEDTLETLSHELGHGVEFSAFTNAPKATQDAIIDEYRQWRFRANNMTVEQLVNSLRNRVGASLFLAKLSPTVRQAPIGSTTLDLNYWLGFAEWFADNVSRWASTDTKAISIVAKFFQEVAKQLRALVAAVTGMQFAPASSVADFLNKMGPGNPVAWQGTIAQPRIHPKDTTISAKTSEFKSWFGDSKVVDKNGDPLQVYHGTNKTQQGEAFKYFDTYGSEYGLMGQGSYFTDNPDIASEYTQKGRGTSPTVYPVYLSLQNPIDMDARGDASAWSKAFSDVDFDAVEGNKNEDYLRAVEEYFTENEYPKYEAAQSIQEGIMSMGHDGITHVGGGRFKGKTDTTRHQVYIAFEPNQIKSVFNQTPTDATEIDAMATAPPIAVVNNSIIGGMAQSVNTPVGQITPNTWSLINQASSQPQRTAMTQFAGVVAQGEISWADWFRQKTVDVLAPVATKLGALFDKGVRNSFGDVNPVQFIRQAFDHARVALDMFKQGGLRMNKDGFWESYNLKDANGKEMSARQVIKEIADLSKKNNEAFGVTKAKVATVLEGMRLSDLRKENATLETLALAHEAAGDFDKADKTREKKILLHMRFAEIDALEQVFNASPELYEIRRIMHASRESVVDAMITSGRISQERGDFWKSVINYVPFDRIQDVFEDISLTQRPTRKGITSLGELPAIRGSLSRPVANVVDNYMNTMAWMVEQSMRNSAAVRTLNVMATPGVDMAKKLKSLKQATNAHMVLPKLYENGEPVYFEMASPYDFAAFVQAPEITSGLLKFMGTSSRLLRTTVTATPMFAIKQVIDDAQRVMFYSGVKNPTAALAKTLAYFPRAWAGAWFGKESAVERTLTSLGIIGDYDFNPTNPVETLEYQTGARSRGGVKWLINKLEQVTKASDMAARLAVYEQTMKETGDAAIAQTRARELINFNRRGSSSGMRTLTHIVPFFNAYAQGMDLMYRGFTGKDASSGLNKAAARKMFMSRVAIMTAMGTMYALAMSDDDQYEDLTDEVRDRNWILPKSINEGFGSKFPIKISVPSELGFIFKSIPERVVTYMKLAAKGQDQGVAKAVTDTLVDAAKNYSITPIPALIKPVMENLTNYSTFTHREIVPKAVQALPASMQYTTNTSELAKKIGKAADVAPLKVDNWIRGTFGLMGSSALMMADVMMNPARPDRSLAQIPFANIALVNPAGSRTKDEFYEFRQQVTEAVAGKNKLQKEDPAAYGEFMRKNAHLIAAAPYINSKVETLSQFRTMRTLYETTTDKTLSSADRRTKIDEINQAEKKIIGDLRAFRSAVMKAAPK